MNRHWKKMNVLLALVPLLLAGPSAAAQEAVAQDERQEILNKGLAYLVKNQCADGRWEADGGKHPVTMTGLAGLALVMDGRRDIVLWRADLRKRTLKHSASVNKAVNWLIEKQARSGLIFSGHESEIGRYLLGHALALIFLSGALEAERVEGVPDQQKEKRRQKIHDAIELGVQYIAEAQATGGGWYFTSRAEGHDLAAVLPTVLQIQALRSAAQCAVVLPKIDPGVAYLLLSALLAKQKTGDVPARLLDTAAALACFSDGEDHRTVSWKAEAALYKEWTSFCDRELPTGRDIRLGRDELTHYFYGHTLNNEEFLQYQRDTAAFLRAKQHKDGSWPPADNVSVGPVCSTALWCILLQPRSRHPAWMPKEGPAWIER